MKKLLTIWFIPFLILYHNCFGQEEEKVIGIIYLMFVVEKTGEITNLKVFKGISEEYDTMALNVMKKAPNWNPGKSPDGKNIAVRFILPVVLKLDDSTHNEINKNFLYWKNDITLSETDFLNQKTDSFIVSIQLLSIIKSQQNEKFDFEVVNRISRKESKLPKNDPQKLKLANLLFDISELYAIELRSNLSNIENKDIDKVNSVTDKIIKKRNKAFKKVISKTNSGQNVIVLQKWIDDISEKF